MPTVRKIANPDAPTTDHRRPTTNGHEATHDRITNVLSSVVGHKDLPPGWAWTTIGEITQPIDKVDPSIWPDKEFVYLDISSIDNTLYQVVEPKSYIGEEAPSRARQLVHGGDVLFSTVRTYLKNIALVPDAYDGQIASTGFSVLRGKTGISSKYLFHFCLTDELLAAMAELQRGTSYPAVRDSDVREHLIPLPPLAEQHRIVAAIEQQLTRLDVGVASLRRAQAGLRRYKAAVLKAACEGRLVPQDASDEPADALLRRILDERAQMAGPRGRGRRDAAQLSFDGMDTANVAGAGAGDHQGRPYTMTIDDPHCVGAGLVPARDDRADRPVLPRGWVWARVDEIGDVQLGQQRAPKYHTGEHMRRYVRAANITWSGLDLRKVLEMNFAPREFEIYRLQQGDILLSEASGSIDEIGKPAIWNEEIPDCCFQKTVIRVRSRGPLPKFLFYHFLSDALTGRISEIARGVGIHHLSAERLVAWHIGVPPLTEQQRIVAEVERRLSVVAEVEAAIAANLKRAERLRQAILKRAFEGKLVPQDPSDEPASVLLERIRRERDGETTRRKAKQLRMEGM